MMGRWEMYALFVQTAHTAPATTLYSSVHPFLSNIHLNYMC